MVTAVTYVVQDGERVRLGVAGEQTDEFYDISGNTLHRGVPSGGSYSWDVDGTAEVTLDASGLVVASGLTVTADGLTVTAGGLVVTAGDLTVTAADVEITAGTISLNDGGTVIQGSTKGTTVVLNTHSGQITMNSASLTDDTVVSFTLTNSEIEALDAIIVNHGSAGTATAYQVGVHTIAAGSCVISVRNISGGSLGEAIVLHFAIIHCAAA